MEVEQKRPVAKSRGQADAATVLKRPLWAMVMVQARGRMLEMRGATSRQRMALEIGPMRVERAQERASHSQRHDYDCRREGNHQYMSKCVKNARLTCWSWEPQPRQAQKPHRHAEHVHRHAWQCGTRKNG